jgi:hypothetical protein
MPYAMYTTFNNAKHVSIKEKTDNNSTMIVTMYANERMKTCKILFTKRKQFDLTTKHISMFT